MQASSRGKEHMLSAGIDIGTSTTKLIISRFTLVNTAGMTHVPKIEIVDKEVIHKSPLYRTPLHSFSMIDMQGVLSIVRREYEKAGISPQEIQTGAVIITGETATKQNAEEMVHFLSEQAGEFLVATAGPDLEGIIAAKGSGAFQYSKESGKTVANIDIGGGTANIAVYQAGVLKGTCTLHIGGRLIEWDGEFVKSISPSMEQLSLQLGRRVSLGERVEKDNMMPMIRYMADALARILREQIEQNDEVLLLGHRPNWNTRVDEIMFSGGVGECIHRWGDPSWNPTEAPYQDIGVWLAEEFQTHKGLNQWKWIPPLETVRATVLGAGMQTTEISGVTIHVEGSRLPIKNLPVYSIPVHRDHFHREHLQESIERAINLFDPEREGRNFALYLSELPILRFKEVQQLAEWLAQAIEAQPNQQEPFVLVISNDMAKAVGQALQRLQLGRDVICIDQISVENGDYLDIGKMLQTEVVPVVVKTLAFHT
ncbi:ethanolamine ammonia-lyase reactivating factor EutA [Ammoniphilus sp. YIM 78166]|uniref:ethanolamine ammonia-lyase reactivating factor EutA n=1 Tax=Ammoniphilus sp. YIM 78166 TaxID=1644106 RepID=UPI00107012F8|nr:ethanolamine ammonia-lyase reactivating factor EutA [Ammoniphilus sp. YIM 78166]